MKNLLVLSIAFILSVSSAFSQVDRTKAPDPQPNPQINIPKPSVFTLENGLQVIVVENHKLPKISYQLYVDHPTNNEGNKAGLGDLFGQLLSSGTENTNKDDFDEKIDFIGATFSSNARGFFASSLTKHSEKLLSLINEVILSPAFPESEFDRLKNQTISELSTVITDPSSMAKNVSGIVNYGKDHPYGEIVTEKTIQNITLEDIKNHFKNNFQPQLSYLVIVGDISTEKAKEYANKYFGNWKKGEKNTKQPVYDIPAANGNQVYFVDKPGAVQSVINISQTVSLKPGHQDEIKLTVLNSILGGGSFSARLMSNLREDKAYTYGCYSRINSDELIGSFFAGGSFRNDVTDSAIVQIMYEINKICSEEVKDDELDLVKKSITGSFARSLENPQTVAMFALNTIRYKLPADYYNNYLLNLEKITKMDLMMVADKYLSPKNMNIIVVGNSSIAEKLSVFDTDGAISYKNGFGEDAIPLKTAPEGVTAQTIIQTYLNKSFIVNGEEEVNSKLNGIGYFETSASSYLAQMDANLIMTRYEGAPNKSAVIMKAGEQTIQKEWFNGVEGGSFVMMQGRKEYNEEKVKEKQKPNFLFSQLYYFNDSETIVDLLGIEEIDGKEFYKIKISSTKNDEFTYEYYGVESGLLELTESFTNDEEGNQIVVKYYLNDYKIAGKGKLTLLIPHTNTLDSQGQKLEFKTKNVVIKKKGKQPAFDGVFK